MTADLSLYCDHSDGQDLLLDRLADGMLTSTEQVTLSLLLNPMADLPRDFHSDYVGDVVVTERDADTYVISWVCPVCLVQHADAEDYAGADL